MVGGNLENLHTKLPAVLHQEVVLQHHDLGAGDCGYTMCGCEDVSPGDDDAGALEEVVLASDGQQLGLEIKKDKNT